MRPLRRLPAPPPWLPLPRRTARLRLTMLYGCSFMIAGVSLLAFTYWLFDRATAGTQAAAGPRALIVYCQGRARLPKPSVSRSVPPPCHHLLQLQAAAQNALDLHVLLVQSAIAIAVMAAIAAALGWFVAGRVLHPLRVITMTARRISATSLHERLALAGPGDEFKELADTLDDLLARLESSFQAQRNFVANASHELRTPLTLDRTLLQVALRDAGATVEQWRCTGQEVLESGKQQERILEALLTLASSEGGLNHRRPVDLSEVTADRLLAIGNQLDRQPLRVQASLSPATLLGDPDLIERLVANLLDNAVQHNIPGGNVDLTTATRDGHATLSVANTGPPIPPAQVDRIFQPFQRLGPVRTNRNDGHGLGLSIVRAIANAHGAALTAHARPEGGLHIEVTFPALDCPPLRSASRGLKASVSPHGLGGDFAGLPPRAGRSLTEPFVPEIAVGALSEDVDPVRSPGHS
jgi:signal transduction histidine kinase